MSPKVICLANSTIFFIIPGDAAEIEFSEGKNMQKNNLWASGFAALAIAFGIMGGGYFVGQMMYNAKVALKIAEAKGLAEKKVEANVAHWSVMHTVRGKKRSEIPKLYKLSERNTKDVIKAIKEVGFSEDEIETPSIDYSYKEYRNENQKLVDQEHVLVSSIRITTKQVGLVAKARENVNKLIAKGINISSLNPVYRFTELNKIKPEMLKEATKNARIAANEFAQNAGVNVGSIRSARQGTFQVSDEGERYGDTGKIKKDVRVVTTIEFYLD